MDLMATTSLLELPCLSGNYILCRINRKRLQALWHTIIPYPLSTGPECGDPMYFRFNCSTITGPVSLRGTEWHPL
ncbi:hypothetical protein GBA52_029073 [Prunus armeniaca]|nr:hypothetical protein GBA52_029073 [Prunus armeniaca]